MSKHSDHIYPTKYKELGYRRRSARMWQFVDMYSRLLIGQVYITRKDMLKDLDKVYVRLDRYVETARQLRG